MSLVDCTECGNKISTEAKACPKCGATNKKREYSNISTWFLSLVIIIAIPTIYYIFETELNPNIPTCESPHGRKVFVDMFDNSPWAKKNIIKVIDVITQLDISSRAYPENRICEVTFRLSNATNKIYIFTFEPQKSGGYITRARPK